MFGKLIGNILGKVLGEGTGNSVVEYFDNKQKLKQQLKLAKLEGKIELERAKVEIKKQRLQQTGEWSKGMVAQMAGWKDEFVLLVVSAPLVMAPVVPDRVLQVFTTLEQTPEWYRYMLITIFLAIYGIKPAWERFKLSRHKNSS